MKNWKEWKAILATLVLMLSVDATYGQAEQPPTNSADGSRNSATRATDESVLNACSSAVQELTASRRLIKLLESEAALLRSRLESEKQANVRLSELNQARMSEAEALRSAVAAERDSIVAKNDVIDAQRKLLDELKAKKRSVWSRIGDVAIGIAAGALLR